MNFSLLQNNEEYSSASSWEHFVCQSSARGNKAEPDVNTLHAHTVSSAQCPVLCLTSQAHLSVMVIIGSMCVLCAAKAAAMPAV